MKPQRLPALLVLVALAACQAVPIEPTTKPKAKASGEVATAPPVAVKATGEPIVAASPVVAPSAAVASAAVAPASPQAAVVATLERPPGAVSVLKGLVSIDAGYIVAAGGGNIVAAGGGNIVAAGGGNISLRSGSAIVAAGGGNIVAAGGGNIVAAGGGNIVAAGGGNIVAAGGGNVLGHNGNAIVAAGGGNYHVLAEGATSPTTPPAPAIGTILPAAGMVISATLVGDALVRIPLGFDSIDQKPVYEVYSDITGSYEIFLPAALEGRVIVHAEVPETKDQRLKYKLLVTDSQLAPDAAPSTIDEDSTVICDYIVQTLASRFVSILLGHPGCGERAVDDWQVMPAVKCTVLDALAKLKAAYQGSAGSKSASFEEVLALSEEVGGIALASMDLDRMVIDSTANSAVQNQPPMPALPAIAMALGKLREGARRRLEAEGPGGFTRTAYVMAANRCKDPGQQFEIRKPADVGDLLVREYFGRQTAFVDKLIEPIFIDLGVNTVTCADLIPGVRPTFTTAEVLVGAGGAVVYKLAIDLLADNNGMRTKIEARLRDFSPRAAGGVAPPRRGRPCATGRGYQYAQPKEETVTDDPCKPKPRQTTSPLFVSFDDDCVFFDTSGPIALVGGDATRPAPIPVPHETPVPDAAPCGGP